MKISRSVLAIVLGSLATVSVASAGTDSDNLIVTASVEDTCMITGGTLAFGVYDTVVGDQLEATTNLSVACTAGSITHITLGQGANATGTSTADAPERQMANGANHLAYSLYSDATYSEIWADTQATGVAFEPTDSDAHDQPVYGVLHAGQDVPKGNYSDTVLATIHF